MSTPGSLAPHPHAHQRRSRRYRTDGAMRPTQKSSNGGKI